MTDKADNAVLDKWSLMCMTQKPRGFKHCTESSVYEVHQNFCTLTFCFFRIIHFLTLWAPFARETYRIETSLITFLQVLQPTAPVAQW